MIEADIGQRYANDGYVTGIDVFSADEIGAYRAAFDQVVEEAGREKSQNALLQMHLTHRFVWDMSVAPAVLDAVEAAVGPDILFLATGFICKFPEENAESFVGWHQDGRYWGLKPPVAHSAWIAIDDSDVASGAMQVIPGSHTGDLLHHEPTDNANNLLRIHRQEVSTELFDERAATPLELKAGQMSIHHSMLLHASQPNRSERRRCGFIARYITPDIAPEGTNSRGETWNPILLRGSDRYGHFELGDAPF